MYHHHHYCWRNIVILPPISFNSERRWAAPSYLSLNLCTVFSALPAVILCQSQIDFYMVMSTELNTNSIPETFVSIECISIRMRSIVTMHTTMSHSSMLNIKGQSSGINHQPSIGTLSLSNCKAGVCCNCRTVVFSWPWHWSQLLMHDHII